MSVVFDARHAHADTDHVAELRIVGGDDQITGPDQHQTRGDRIALYLGDGDLTQIAPTTGVLEEVMPLLKIRLLRDRVAGGAVYPEARQLSRSGRPLRQCQLRTQVVTGGKIP